MLALSTDLQAFTERLRDDLRACGAVEELLLDTLIMAAIRLKLLYLDARALDPFDQAWSRAHNAALRAFFRAYDTLHRRRKADRQTPSPRPAPAPSPSRPKPPARVDDLDDLDDLGGLDDLDDPANLLGPPLSMEENRKILVNDIAFLESVGRHSVAAMLRAELESFPGATAAPNTPAPPPPPDPELTTEPVPAATPPIDDPDPPQRRYRASDHDPRLNLRSHAFTSADNDAISPRASP